MTAPKIHPAVRAVLKEHRAPLTEAATALHQIQERLRGLDPNPALSDYADALEEAHSDMSERRQEGEAGEAVTAEADEVREAADTIESNMAELLGNIEDLLGWLDARGVTPATQAQPA